MTVEESDALIISNWNKIVHKKDIVYVLGDITMEKPKLIEQYLKQLNGIIRIVGGNHDTIKCCKVFQDLQIPVMGVLNYKGFTSIIIIIIIYHKNWIFIYYYLFSFIKNKLYFISIIF